MSFEDFVYVFNDDYVEDLAGTILSVRTTKDTVKIVLGPTPSGLCRGRSFSTDFVNSCTDKQKLLLLTSTVDHYISERNNNK